jgi:CheY-like chemotaxis protein
LVEDNPADIYLIHLLVAEHGNNLRLWVVSNGREALSFVRKQGPFQHVPTPRLILLDLHLPYVPGTEVLAALRHLAPYKQTPVVIFSSTEGEREKLRCLELGANAYEQKPTGFDAYCATVHAILEH